MSSAAETRPATSAEGRPRILSGKAMFSATVRCGNKA